VASEKFMANLQLQLGMYMITVGENSYMYDDDDTGLKPNHLPIGSADILAPDSDGF
jgi:hypothetical protein